MNLEQQSGKVKWFSEKDGYGFITDEDNVDHYFTIRNIIGAELPMNGQTVEFIAEQGRKGPIASNITLFEQEVTESKLPFKDDRIVCSNCERKIVPRIYFKNGEPEYSVCPFCANTVKTFSFDLLGFILGLTLDLAKLSISFIKMLVDRSSLELNQKVIVGTAILLIAFVYSLLS